MGHKQVKGKARVKKNKKIGKERPGQGPTKEKERYGHATEKMTKIRNVEGIIHRGKKSKSIKT